MELDRQSIEKKDFPIARRGYEPEIVDAHLAQVAREVEELRRASRSRAGESLASAASAQVQAIVEAAETTAAEIERQAQMESQRIRQEAERNADRVRDDAVQRAQGHLDGVSQATGLMVQRVDAMESELTALVESLRTGANRLTADLSLLEGNMGELYDAAGRRREQSAAPGRTPTPPIASPVGESEPESAASSTVDEPVTESHEPEPVEEAEEAEELPAAEEEPIAEEDIEEAEVEEPAGTPGGGRDIDGARLIALNMALNGQSRDEADRYLAENFDLENRDALLDEVFSTVDS